MSHFSLPWSHANTQNVTVYAFDLHMHHAAATGNVTVLHVSDYDCCEPEEPMYDDLIFTVDSTTAWYRGSQVTLDDAPFIQDGRTMVPFRFIGEALGAEVDWDNVERTAYFARGDVFIAISVGVPVYDNDGVYRGTPVIVGSRTFVPVGFVAAEMGAEFSWDGAARTVTIQL
jgi:hypothetical protein